MARLIGVVLAVAVAATGVTVAGPPARAKTIEERVDLPISVTDIRGQTIHHTIQVTIYRDDARKYRQPFLILTHGRSAKAAERAKEGPGSYATNARYFVARGFAVFFLLRVGYGATGGPDVEDSGACQYKIYPPVYEAAAQQSLAVIDYAKAQSYVNPARGLVVGQSFGGTTAIALAAKNPPGILAAVNFAGGGGGNPDRLFQNPCRDDLLTEMFAAYGRTARIPTLWLYSENDRYFGVKIPRAWFEAFRAQGGEGRFVQLPPYKNDGHRSFSLNPAAWRPEFEAFVRQVFGGPSAPVAQRP